MNEMAAAIAVLVMAGMVAGTLLFLRLLGKKFKRFSLEPETNPLSNNFAFDIHDRQIHPIHAAAFNGQRDLVQLLIEQGVDLNLRDSKGWTPLFWAIEDDQREVVRFLISRGAELNAQDELGATALHRAAAQNKLVLSELLLSKGASAQIKDNFGNTYVAYFSDESLEVMKNRLEKA